MLKEWIYLKRGFVSSKHYHRIGVAIWLYLYIIDLAEWETGKVWEWRDKDAAKFLGLNIETVRDQRQKLTEAGYITCKQKQYRQEIQITKWVSPKRLRSTVETDQGTTLPRQGGGHGRIKPTTLQPISRIIKGRNDKKKRKTDASLEDYLE